MNLDGRAFGIRNERRRDPRSIKPIRDVALEENNEGAGRVVDEDIRVRVIGRRALDLVVADTDEV